MGGYVSGRVVTPNPSLKRRPATAATAWPLQAPWVSSFRGQSASASTVALARTLGRTYDMLRLADTTLRLYRKGDGRVSVRWRSFLMIYAKSRGFRLSAYLNRFDTSATFPDGQTTRLDDFGYSDSCAYELDHMIHDAWASGVVEMPVIQGTAATLRVEYRLFSHDGQGDPSVLELVAPVLAYGVRAQRNRWRPSAA